MIGSIFPTSPGGGEYGEQDIIPDDEQEAKTQMMNTVAGRGKYFYNYTEYLYSNFLKLLCSCCCKKKDCFKRRMKRLERHENASEKLCKEMDIVNFIYVRRLSQFISKMVLDKHQRALVTSFKKYQLEDLCCLDDDAS